METKNENLDICKKCGGYCCKKCGCDYAVEDFLEIKKDYLLSKLEEGYISIVSIQNFKILPNGEMVNLPFLYLRARNINRPVVDLLSMKTTCASLTDMGCQFDYEHRPMGGKNLVPVEGMRCYPREDAINIVKGWERYQNILEKIVKRLTGKSVDEKLREDIENLFFDLLCNHVEGVAKSELSDIKRMLPLLVQIYFQEYQKAKKRFQQSPERILNKKQ